MKIYIRVNVIHPSNLIASLANVAKK